MVQFQVDRFGRVIVGTYPFIECLTYPEGDLAQLDWWDDGFDVKLGPGPTAVEGVLDPLAIGIGALLGGACVATYGILATCAYIVDKLTGRSGYRNSFWARLNRAVHGNE